MEFNIFITSIFKWSFRIAIVAQITILLGNHFHYTSIPFPWLYLPAAYVVCYVTITFAVLWPEAYEEAKRQQVSDAYKFLTEEEIEMNNSKYKTRRM